MNSVAVLLERPAARRRHLSQSAAFALLASITVSFLAGSSIPTPLYPIYMAHGGVAGQPLPHMWGPYGIGQSGSFIFACGDPNARGTLYWTNGNDPDSTDVVNNIVVTSPSEKLVTGCVYDGQPFCWSTERQFQIFPSLTIFGQFTTQEVAGAKGCWLEWSLSVQSNGISDQSACGIGIGHAGILSRLHHRGTEATEKPRAGRRARSIISYFSALLSALCSLCLCGESGLQPRYATISRITRPCTSVRRKSRPAYRYVSFVWSNPSRCSIVACRS